MESFLWLGNQEPWLSVQHVTSGKALPLPGPQLLPVSGEVYYLIHLLRSCI